LEKGKFGEFYNMGSEEGIKIYDLAELVAKKLDKEINIEVDYNRVRPWEIWHLQSDNTKLYKIIDYRPKVSLEEAVEKVIEDYKLNGWSFE
jgi:nucleoside-diphosphate-sugar epimerase